MVKETGRIIKYREIEDTEKKDSDWDILKGETFFERKTIIPKNNNPILKLFPELKLRRKQKVALVLGGGGAKGLAHVGVIRELEKYDVDVDLIVGTSMGAIIGALYALEGNLKLVDDFLDIKTKDLVSLSDFSLSIQGFIKGKKIESILRGLFGSATFADTKIPLILNGVDIGTGKEAIFTEGKLLDAVRASMAIPIVFQPQKIKGKMYVDGGLVNNVPYSLVPTRYKKVVVSNLTWRVPEAKQIKNGLHYLRHIVALLQHNATHVPDDKRVIHVKPDMRGLHLWDFDKLPMMVKRGDEAAKHIFPRHFKKSNKK